MSSNDDSGEKTEDPTDKRLRDARRDGDVPKSKDLSQTVSILLWIGVLTGLSTFFSGRLGALFQYAWTEVDLASPHAMASIGSAAAKTFLMLTIVPLAIVSLGGVLIEFLQAGPVFAPKRISPDASKLSPGAGIKRIFSIDNVFELAKSLLKTALLATLTYLVLKHYLTDIIAVSASGIESYVGLDRRILLMFCGSMIVLFLFVSVGDFVYQKYSYRKRLRMSKSDVKREHKQDQGDPHLRGQRQRLQRQWAKQNPKQAAREATALLVNPTHIAVAILYQPEETAVPVITAKGEGNLALLMRREAEDAGVPIIRDIPLARALHYRTDEDDFIPEEYFDAIAEIIAWAERVRGTDAAQSRN